MSPNAPPSSTVLRSRGSATKYLHWADVTMRSTLALIVVVTCMSFGQDRPIPATPSNDMVFVPVTITALQNAFSLPLEARDFTLSEDGVTQTITYFSGRGAPGDYGVIVRVGENVSRGSATLTVKEIEQWGISEAIAAFRAASNGRVWVDDDRSNRSYDPILNGLRRLAQLNPKRALIFITDNGGFANLRSSLANKLSTRVYVLFIRQNDGNRDNVCCRPLVEMTEQTGGSILFTEPSTTLRAAATELGDQLRDEYILGFNSTNPARDGKWRKLSVKFSVPAKWPKAKIHTRARYLRAKADVQ